MNKIDNSISIKEPCQVNAECREIRRQWTDSERRVRALKASLAQTRLALSILFREINPHGMR